MKNKIYFKLIFLFFIILFLSLFYFYSPNFFSGFLVKDNFSNYSFVSFNSSFLYNETFIINKNVSFIVINGYFVTDKNPYFEVEFNNTSYNLYSNNTNIVAFVTKFLNVSTFNKSNVSNNFTLNKSKNNISLTNSSDNNLTKTTNLTNTTYNNISNITNNKNNTSNISNLTVNISSNKTFNITNNNTLNFSNISNSTINLSNVTLTNDSINLSNNTNLTNNSLNITTNMTINNTNTTNLTNTTILEYGNGFFDYNNDGIVSKQDAIDFEIKNNFTNESCTFWSVVSEKNSFFVCSGNNTCCSSYGLNSSYNDPSYFVLYYDNIKSNTGRVLAKLDNLSFSNPLLFNFSGEKETLYEIKKVIAINEYIENLTIKTNGLFKGNITFYYNKTSSCTPNFNSDWIVYLEDNCNITKNISIYPYKLIIKGSKGNFTIKSNVTLTVKSLDFTPDDFNGDASFNIEKGGNLIIKP